MNQKFLKHLISECPLTDFFQNGNVTKRALQLVGNSTPEWDKIHDDYLNKYGQNFEKLNISRL